MLIAVEDVVDEAVDDGRLPHRLVPQEHYFVFQQRRDRPLGKIQVAYVCHICCLNIIINAKKNLRTIIVT